VTLFNTDTSLMILLDINISSMFRSVKFGYRKGSIPFK